MAITAATPMITPSMVSAVAHHVAPHGLQGDPRRAAQRRAGCSARGGGASAGGGAAATVRGGLGRRRLAAGVVDDPAVGDADHAVA